jgi:ribosomal protein S18 acetylase RimI-like enzyme
MVEVREAAPADRPAIRDVHVASVHELAAGAYDDAVIDAWTGDGDRDPSVYGVDDDDTVVLVADDGDEVVGFGELADGPDVTASYEVDAGAEIRAVYVAPDRAGEGVGSALLRELEAGGRARGVSTVVLTASTNAVAFYEHHGYERVERTAYAFGENASGPVVVMRKRL